MKYFSQDRRAMRIADRHNMVNEYKMARRHHLTPLEALEDLIVENERSIFY